MTSPAKRRFFFLGQPRKGVALVLVLAFVVLLASIIVAFFARVQSEQQISRASSNQTKVKLLADGATDTIVGNLKQEIVASSTPSSPAPGVTIYMPTLPKDMVPARDSNLSGAAGLGNLVKVSTITGGKATDDAAESRKIDLKRWNKPLFVTPTSDTDDTPATAFPTVPQWIYVQRDGKQVGTPSTSASSANTNDPNAVIGRYAYVIYDEGGLLDVNVAGYPSDLATNPSFNSSDGYKGASKYKSSLTFVDFTQIPGLTVATDANAFANALAGWRQQASAQAGGSFPNYSFTQNGLKSFVDSVRATETGFLRAGNLPAGATFTQSDKMFAGRQQLIQFLNSLADGGAVAKTNLRQAMPFLTTYSRALDQPSFIPDVQKNTSAPKVLPLNKGGTQAVGEDKNINPNFVKVRVTTQFTRNDGTVAMPGDPLVNKRFALQRLSWVTYKGPSANRTQSDPDIQSLIKNGVPWSYLQKGTEENIKKYFGLTWNKSKDRWEYNFHNGGNTGVGSIMRLAPESGSGGSASTYVQAANREPDFFELLKAGIAVGSLGKAASISDSMVPQTGLMDTNWNPTPDGYDKSLVPINLRYNLDSSVDYHIIQIGANILSEVNPTSYPIRIAFDDAQGRGLWEFQGVTDLPYLTYIFNGAMRRTGPTPLVPANSKYIDKQFHQFPFAATGSCPQATGYVVQVPAVWNPYDPNGNASVDRPSRFKVVVDSNDPIGLAKGQPNKLLWCATRASLATEPANTPDSYTGNDGTNPPSGPVKYSYEATGLGKTSQSPNYEVHDEVTFIDSNGLLFREPTLLFSPNSAAGKAQRVGGDKMSPVKEGNFTSMDPDPLPGGDTGNRGGGFGGSLSWGPLVIGSFPLAFQVDDKIAYAGVPLIGTGDASVRDTRVYLTYRLQYEYPKDSGNWITYDTKYGRTSHGQVSFHVGESYSPCIVKGRNDFSPYSWATAIDPRTSRFGMFMEVVSPHRSVFYDAALPPPVVGVWGGTKDGWINNYTGTPFALQLITYPIRPDNNSGFTLVNLGQKDPYTVLPLNLGANGLGAAGQPNVAMADVPFPAYEAGWTRPMATRNPGIPYYTLAFAPGMYAQNNPAASYHEGRYSLADTPSPTTNGPSYYADPDGVVRRADAAYIPPQGDYPASTPVGLPPASIQGYHNQPASLITPSLSNAKNTALLQSQSRPLLLHRPFRSVAELGYVFRDLPWKSLSFSTPESADAGLIDLFCINETESPNALVAGKINLNTAPKEVLAATVGGASVDDPKVFPEINNSGLSLSGISSSLAISIATALKSRIQDTAGLGPLVNISELVGKFQTSASIAPGISYKPNDPAHNAGVDLPAGYIDGRKSYVGFSGSEGTPTGKDLSSVFTPVSTAGAMQSFAYVKRLREAPIRALAGVGQVRVWNLMMDVVAQSGRTSQAGKFTIDGEQRYWVHLAVDRMTGQILDKQVEVVKE